MVESIYAVKRYDNNSIVAIFKSQSAAYSLQENFDRSDDYGVYKHVCYEDLADRDSISRG